LLVPRLRDMRVAETADRRPILFQQPFQDLQTRADGELEQLSACIDQQIHQRK
jgi:hypothetical protein